MNAVGKRGLSLILVLLAGCATALPEVAQEKLPSVPAEFKQNFTVAAPAAAEPRACATAHRTAV